MKDILPIAVVLAIIVAASFLILSGVYWLVCWALGWIFQWKIAIAITAVYFVIAGIFKGGKNNA